MARSKRKLTREAEDARQKLEAALGTSHNPARKERFEAIFQALPAKLKKELRGKVRRPRTGSSK
jgi:hypothetical protein